MGTTCRFQDEKHHKGQKTEFAHWQRRVEIFKKF